MSAANNAAELPFFFGKLTRDEAEQLLMNNAKEGSFLARVSTSSPGDFVLSLVCNRQVLHFQIRHQGEVRRAPRAAAVEPRGRVDRCFQ
jgi:hypothetical protein